MPNFSAFSQRLSQSLNPMQRKPQTGPMFEGEMPLPSNMNNPMSGGGRPMGANGAIPLVQNSLGGDLPPSSGTGADPAQSGGSRKMVDKIKENVASQVRYEDIAPKMETEQPTPAFQAKPTKGVWNHLKAGFQAAGGASRMYPNQPLAPLVGAVAGAIDPRIAQVMDYQGRVVPDSQREQAAVRGRNSERQKAFQSEIQSRTAVGKMNEANQPTYKPVPGGEFQTLYNEHDPSDTKTINGPDNKPIRNASVVNTETRTGSAEEISRQKAMDTAERDVEKKKANFEKAKLDFDHKKEIEDINAKHKKELEVLRQGHQDRRASKAEGGRNTRAGNAEEGKDRRVKARRGDEETTTTEEVPRAPNVFQQTKPNSFDWRDLGTPSTITPTGKKKQAPPPR